MILTKEVEIKIVPFILKHYMGLKYNVKIGDIINIPIEHLPKGSHIKIKVKCDVCRKIEKEITYRQYLLNTNNNTINYSCGNICSRKKAKQTCLKKYGVENPMQNKKIFDKGKQTKKERYGNENFNNREKYKQTCINNFKVQNLFQSEEIKFKIKKTNLEIFGFESPMKNKKVLEKGKQTKLKNYGNENFNNREQAKETCLKKYGTNHQLQNIEIYRKSQINGFRLKDYILPSGKIIKIQGYENLALDLLLNTYREGDLIIEDKKIENKIGKIWYITDIKKKRRYYPDIYIISENKIIEVKSTYYYKRDIIKNLLKEQACLKMGMKFKFMIFNDKKQLIRN